MKTKCCAVFLLLLSSVAMADPTIEETMAWVSSKIECAAKGTEKVSLDLRDKASNKYRFSHIVYFSGKTQKLRETYIDFSLSEIRSPRVSKHSDYGIFIGMDGKVARVKVTSYTSELMGQIDPWGRVTNSYREYPSKTKIKQKDDFELLGTEYCEKDLLERIGKAITHAAKLAKEEEIF